MTRFLLDTNIVSDPSKKTRSDSLQAWMSGQADESLFISVVAIAETRRGILKLPEGPKKRALEAWEAGPLGPAALFRGRILPFDLDAALVWAELMTAGDLARRSRSPLDMVLAAIAIVNTCVVVTDNERHFAGVVEMINPLRGRT